LTVKEFLQRVKEGSNKPQALTFMMDLLTILDEFDSEACSTFAGKIRAQMGKANEATKTEIPVTDLIDLSSLADKLDATNHEVYAVQFNERLEEIARETGCTIPEVRNAARQYRNGER